MTLLEFLGTAGGGVAATVGGKVIIEIVKRQKQRSIIPPPQQEIQIGPKRSFSPASFAAVLDEKQAMREFIKEQGAQTGFLRQIAEGVGTLSSRVGEMRDHVVEHVADSRKDVIAEVQKTRHNVRTDLQTVRLEIASALGQPPPRQRMPSRSGRSDDE
jgi:hypothetical protein